MCFGAEYSGSIDMWSVGCIFAEMLGRKPLFPGKDYIHQLKLIMEVLGTQPESALQFVSSSKARAWIMSLPPKPKVLLKDLFLQASPSACDLLAKRLVFDPAGRISVGDALKHPYLSSLHDPQLEPISQQPFAQDQQEQSATEEQLRRMVYDEVALMAAAAASPAAGALSHAAEATPRVSS